MSMTSLSDYRDNGAIGALLDEYEKSILELKEVIRDVKDDDLIEIVDHTTLDSDCKSIQLILAHVVSAGYNYAIETRRSLGEQIVYKIKDPLNSAAEYILALDKMFSFNEKLFVDYPNIKLEEYHPEKKIIVRWGQAYDVDQLFEHAIVHILRHRRQIERFKLTLASE